MLNLSIMPLFADSAEAVCEDIIRQQREGISTCAMMMMTFNAEGTPPVEKAKEQCRIYDLYRERLDKAGAKHGVLVQATMGHITLPYAPHPFQTTVSVIDGKESGVTCCPLDPGFRAYMKEQMRILTTHKPGAVMIDDDVAMLYRDTRGCACHRHMAAFNRRAGTNMTRQELYAHITGNSPEDQQYARLYVDVQRESLVDFVKYIREGIDEVDPTVQGIVSGIYVSTFCEFSGEVGNAFAGKGNPVIVRYNGGPYAKQGGYGFTSNVFRAAILRENLKDQVDIFLAETDTCPHNRYSTAAAMMHAHYSAIIMQGAKGAKHWITELCCWRPESGEAYRRILAKNKGFYEKLAAYSDKLQPFGCRIPLTRHQHYVLTPDNPVQSLAPWAACILERMGLPLYFGNGGSGAVFLDDFAVDGFDDGQIREFLSGTLVLSVGAAEKLGVRGFREHIGVEVGDWEGVNPTLELLNGKRLGGKLPYGMRYLKPCAEGVEELTQIVHENKIANTVQALFPGVTKYSNALGGRVYVFNADPDMPYLYFTAFSMLNAARKQQFAQLLAEAGCLDVYYPGDAEIYLHAGRLPDGQIMAVLYNLGFDELEEVPLVCKDTVVEVEKLCSDGTRSRCSFSENGPTVIGEPLKPMMPLVLFLTVKKDS